MSAIDETAMADMARREEIKRLSIWWPDLRYEQLADLIDLSRRIPAVHQMLSLGYSHMDPMEALALTVIHLARENERITQMFLKIHMLSPNPLSSFF